MKRDLISMLDVKDDLMEIIDRENSLKEKSKKGKGWNPFLSSRVCIFRMRIPLSASGSRRSLSLTTLF
jgi:hypothetical protein